MAISNGKATADATRDAKLYKEIRTLHHLLTVQLDCLDEADVEVQLRDLHSNMEKKSLRALEFVVWDLSNYGVHVLPIKQHPGRRLSKSECAALLVQWVRDYLISW